MKTLIVIFALVICSEAWAQELPSYDSGVRIPLEAEESSREVIIVIGRRPVEDIPPEYERYLPQERLSTEEDDEFGEGVVVSRRRLYTFDDGLEFGTRVVGTDPSDSYHGSPTDDRRSFEFVWRF